MNRILASLALIALAGCSTPISNGSPVANINNAVAAVVDPKGQLKTDLTDTASNFDQATAIGAIPANLPLAACQHSINQFLGFETVPGAALPQSFTPLNGGPISLASIGIINALQLQTAVKGGITISPSCYAVLGYLQVLTATNILQIAAPALPGLGGTVGLALPKLP